MKIVDCRKMACPLPVVTTRRALEEAGGETIQVLLDRGAPSENVTRFATSRGYIVQEHPAEEGIALTLSTGETANGRSAPETTIAGRKVMLITSNSLGDGADDLGRLLMKNFIVTLLDLDELPDRMLFLNGGVFLTTEGSEVLEALEKLGNLGVEVLSCGACLDFFQVKEKLKAGGITNMFTIAESMMNAGSVIKV